MIIFDLVGNRVLLDKPLERLAGKLGILDHDIVPLHWKPWRHRRSFSGFGGEQFITARPKEFLPFLPAYDLCLIDVSEIRTLSTPALASRISKAWHGYDLGSKSGTACHIVLKRSGRLQISYPEELIHQHPVSGRKFRKFCLDRILLQEHLEHLESPLHRMNFLVSSIPEGLPNDEFGLLVRGQKIVVSDPRIYEEQDRLDGMQSYFGCCVIDISRIRDLAPEQIADRVYLAWIDLRLKWQSWCTVIVKERGSATFKYNMENEQEELLPLKRSTKRIVPEYVQAMTPPKSIKTPEAAYLYAKDALNGPFPEGEAVIARSAEQSFNYALHVLKKKPFPAGEPAIATSAEWSAEYVKYVLKGPFPAGEPVLAKSADWACRYACELKTRFPAGEPAIAKNADWAEIYARIVLQGPFPEGEAAIAEKAQTAYHYALHVLRAPFPAGEPAINADKKYAIEYAAHVLKRPYALAGRKATDQSNEPA